MSTEKNKEQARRWFELFNLENWEDHLEELAAYFSMPEEAADYFDGQRAFRNAFANYQFTIDQIVAEGDKVAVFGTVRATHVGEFPSWELRGIAATDKELEWSEVHMASLVDGKWDVSDYHFMVDGVSRLVQLGVLPMPEELASS